MRITAIIPARYGSTRFEGKPLAIIDNKPMIQHVYERTRQCRLFERVLVATDHEEILKTVGGFGGEAVLTSPHHRSGTDRLAEVAENIDTDIIVNVQGDEPLLEPEMLEAGLVPFFKDKTLLVSTLASEIVDEGEIFSSDVVKVVFDTDGYALYFSRSPIPYRRRKEISYYHKHIGIYFYTRDFLLRLTRLKPTPLELSEGLEQLRIIENGFKIKVIITKHNTIGVDTPKDLKMVEKVIKTRGEEEACPKPSLYS